MSVRPLGDSACLVEFPTDSAGSAIARVHGLMEALEEQRPDGVLDLVPSFNSLAAHFRSGDPQTIFKWMCCSTSEARVPDGVEKRIPVCYDGPDLEEVAAATGLSRDEVIWLHGSAVYTVAAVGFSPGFPYLTGLPEKLHLPRRSTPRTCVEAGSVAIAGGQAGIYPSASPGGWHVLGRTGETLFDPDAALPALLRPGDRVR
ncbi:MAG: 5-oxoprolinase subunit PxpB, partial [Verrucomicrobiaceae bacterium]